MNDFSLCRRTLILYIGRNYALIDKMFFVNRTLVIPAIRVLLWKLAAARFIAKDKHLITYGCE